MMMTTNPRFFRAIGLFVGMVSCSDGLLNTGAPQSTAVTGGDTSTATDQPTDTLPVMGEDSETSITIADQGVEDTDPCGEGASVDGLCWYLGEPNQSCYDVCETRGGYNPDTRFYVGSRDQGGNWEACSDILGALEREGTVYPGERDDGLGLGCHRWDDGLYYWLYTPDFDPSHKAYKAQVACACYNL